LESLKVITAIQLFPYPEIYMESRRNPVKINRGEGVHHAAISHSLKLASFQLEALARR